MVSHANPTGSEGLVVALVMLFDELLVLLFVVGELFFVGMGMGVAPGIGVG